MIRCFVKEELMNSCCGGSGATSTAAPEEELITAGECCGSEGKAENVGGCCSPSGEATGSPVSEKASCC
jgi:hypothetical protein